MKVHSFLPSAGGVIVHVVDPGRIDDAETAAILSAAEQEQAARFRFEKDARHWRACRSALRTILGKALGIRPSAVEIELEEYGKPVLPPPFQHLHFNLSHCHDLALIALGVDGPLGVDVEASDRGKSLLGCETSFCHPDEIAGLPNGEEERAAALLDLWTSKEALLKALGTGMSLAPETVSLVPGGERMAGAHPLLRPFRLQSLQHLALDRHFAKLAVPVSCERVEIFA